MQEIFKYPRINKIHQIVEKITRFDQKVQNLCILLSHELLSTKIHFNLHIIYYLFQDNFKNQKIIKIQQVHQKIHTKPFFLLFKLFSHLNLKRLEKCD